MIIINENRAEELKSKLVRVMECAAAAIGLVNNAIAEDATVSPAELLQIPDRIQFLILNANWAAEHALQLTTEPS